MNLSSSFTYILGIWMYSDDTYIPGGITYYNGFLNSKE